MKINNPTIAISATNTVLDLGIPGVFKDYNFFVENLDALPRYAGSSQTLIYFQS